VLSHTVDTLLRKGETTSHTTDAALLHALASYILDTTTDALLRKEVDLPHTTDAVKRQAVVISASTDALLRKGEVRFHTTDAAKRQAAVIAHSTDATKRQVFTQVHTTDAILNDRRHSYGRRKGQLFIDGGKRSTRTGGGKAVSGGSMYNKREGDQYH
jgi:hypothetical protein